MSMIQFILRNSNLERIGDREGIDVGGLNMVSRTGVCGDQDSGSLP